MKILVRHLLPTVILTALLCAAGGCNRGEEPAEETDPPAEAGTWKPGELARVAVLAEGGYRVQEATTAEAGEVAGMLRKAGAATAEAVVIEAPAEVGAEPVVKLRAALRQAGFGITVRQIGRDESPAPERFEATYMYWADGEGFDTTDALAVVTGEVEAIACQAGPAGAAERAVVRIREFLRADREAGPEIAADKWIDPARHKWLVTGGADGLWPGDKVVVLLSEYDGGLGIVPRRGGDCRWGAKLADWDDPALESVRYALAEGMEKAMEDKTHGPLLRNIGAEAMEEMNVWE